MKLPSDASVRVPFVGLVPSVAVSVVLPSTSVSLPSTLPLTAVSSVVAAASFAATGASFTPVTVIVTVATFDAALPSLAV